MTSKTIISLYRFNFSRHQTEISVGGSQGNLIGCMSLSQSKRACILALAPGSLHYLALRHQM